MIYVQNYHPLASSLFSLLFAALPVIVLFVLLVVKRASVPYAAAGGALTAFLVATIVYRMPVSMASLSFLNGALFALLPICWVLIGAMLLYNITVETGCFERIKASVAGLSPDHRLQAILIAFCFGAFLEGAAGAGTPVAICAAMMVGLGFDPFQAACLCLIANTSPVAYGGFGTPLLTLQSVTGIDIRALSDMAGNQLPIISCIVPLWLVRSMCGWKETREVLPAILVGGGTFALCQFGFAHSSAFPLTDLAGGLISLVVMGLFLRFWQPKRLWRYETRHLHGIADRVEADALIQKHVVSRMPLHKAISAWMPFILLCGLMVLVGTNKKALDSLRLGPVRGVYEFHIPGLDNRVVRTPPVVEIRTREAAVFKFNWITTPGTPVAVTALVVILLLRVTRAQMRNVIKRTARQMRIPIPTIIFMLGLGSITRLGGLDATLGMAFKNTGVAYPFFAAMLGWLGVFLTGTDSGSNALFGSLQKITALQLGLSPVLICVANSSGGVMGKMIDAQSICVATAATEKIGTEADIFKAVLRHSIVLAALIGLLVLLQAYVYPFTLMVPR
jgi:L-lactate transport